MVKEYSRTQRIAEQMQREIAMILQREVQDPRMLHISVTEVQVTRDLALAKVYISSYMENQHPIEEILHALNRAAGFFRSLLASRMQLRTTPQLKFVHDESIAQGSHMQQLIDKAVKEDKKEKE